MRTWLRRLCVVGVLATALACSAVPAVLAAPVVPVAEGALTRVLDGRNAAYLQVLAEFDAALDAAPDDAALAVARCRFVSEFTDEDYGDWIEGAEAEFQACSSAIEISWPSNPVAQMFALEQLWGAEAVEEGETLLEGGAHDWPAPLHRQLLTILSSAILDHSGDKGRAGELAVRSVRLGEFSLVARAVDHLIALGDVAAAATLLRDAPPALSAWEAKARVQVALTLPDPDAAVAELSRYADARFEVDTVVAARAHLRAGQIAIARELLQSTEGRGAALQKLRFDAAMAAEDFDTAAALVDPSDVAQFAVNAERFALLASQAPRSLATPTMLIAALAYLAVLVFIALIPGMVFAPVHYRGLIRQVHGRPASPLFASIGLRHAWIGGAVMLCAPLVAAAVVEPASLTMLLAGETNPSGDVIFRISLWGTVLGLLLLSPIMRNMGLRMLIGDRTALLEWWRVLLAWACLMLIAWVLQVWHAQSGGDTSTLQTMAVDALAVAGRDSYGPMTTLLVTALLVPVFEELIFRGLILGGLSRHISFGWANALQAALFAGIHDDPPRFLFYFALGLFAGWLVRRNRSLGPAIALHVANNTFAISMRMLA